MNQNRAPSHRVEGCHPCFDEKMRHERRRALPAALTPAGARAVGAGRHRAVPAAGSIAAARSRPGSGSLSSAPGVGIQTGAAEAAATTAESLANCARLHLRNCARAHSPDRGTSRRRRPTSRSPSRDFNSIAAARSTPGSGSLSSTPGAGIQTGAAEAAATTAESLANCARLHLRNCVVRTHPTGARAVGAGRRRAVPAAISIQSPRLDASSRARPRPSSACFSAPRARPAPARPSRPGSTGRRWG
jgi:hypothetical protein